MKTRNLLFGLPIILVAQSILAQSVPNSGSYNLHLEDRIHFNPIKPGSDPVRGQALFGLGVDGMNEDPSQALFEGKSMVAGGFIVSNGRTCFTCHRGPNDNFGLPVPPLSDAIPKTDTLFTEIEADAQGDPDASYNLNQLGLIKYRPNRFNPSRPQSDPYRKVFFWRKSQKLINVGFAQGFLNAGRGRVMFETARGAVFSHTQAGDERFDDLFLEDPMVSPNPLQKGHDMEAFQFGIFSDPLLAALRDPSDPLHETLVNDPFATVSAQTQQQKKGRKVFKKYCFSCHNTPNVFNNLSNVDPLGTGERPDNFPSFAPAVGRLFNVGVAERNLYGLRFTEFIGEVEGVPQFGPIIIPLANEDGTINMHEVTFDIGLAATTGRTEDIGRFKVPQLRELIDNAPYFHDNSAATIEEVVDYFNSDDYNNSKDGKKFPIHLNNNKRQALIEFLKIL